ncbi:glycosyltransferase family 4 protein [Snuella sedimenti]|uniref:Glycosyltransferase family 4 protein n=1 Tax=Snuella sedimenti TaxID=2798802 RepID=A0A8J7LS13_9FLAO|nr:glycosyltransferase family 4 protein [Snuella sedimenti]MBJ6367905.1 glycosyltransferase family 4 protein [Snuella sedimenti]
MKIAIYSGDIPSTTFIEHLIKGVAETHDVLLFGTRKEAIFYDNRRIKVYGVSKHRILRLIQVKWRVFLLLLRYPSRFKRALKEVNKLDSYYNKYNAFCKVVPVLLYLPDVFHVQWAKDLEKWLFLKTAFGVKLIVSLRGAHINYSPIAEPQLADSYRNNFPEVDGFHAVSAAIAREAQQYGAPKDSIEVIHSLVPKVTFEQFATYKKREGNVVRLVSVGRFHWKKGYRYALDAVKMLKDKGLSVSYTIISSNSITEDILFQMHQLDLKNEVTVLNGLPQQQLFETMKTFDCLLLPSLEEGIANVVLEAMALGIPVVSTNCGGMAEVVVPNETGWLVPVRDPETLAEAIQTVCQTPEADLQRIVLNAHGFVKTHFNAEAGIKQFLGLYESLFE